MDQHEERQKRTGCGEYIQHFGAAYQDSACIQIVAGITYANQRFGAKISHVCPKNFFRNSTLHEQVFQAVVVNNLRMDNLIFLDGYCSLAVAE